MHLILLLFYGFGSRTSEYLHPFSKDRLLGIGYEADEDSGVTTGVKLTMFDTFDPTDMTELKTERLKADYLILSGYQKAVVIDSDRNLICFMTENEYHIYSYSEAEGFVRKKSIELDSVFNARGVYIEKCVYITDTSGVTVISTESCKVLARVDF